MAYELRDNSGTLFKNDRQENQNQPGYTGKVMVGGVTYYINGWVKESTKGKFFSLSFKPIDAPPQDRQAPRRDDRHLSEILDDEVPF